MKRKFIALALCMALVMSIAVPNTLAMGIASDSSDYDMAVEANAPENAVLPDATPVADNATSTPDAIEQPAEDAATAQPDASAAPEVSEPTPEVPAASAEPTPEVAAPVKPDASATPAADAEQPKEPASTASPEASEEPVATAAPTADDETIAEKAIPTTEPTAENNQDLLFYEKLMATTCVAELNQTIEAFGGQDAYTAFLENLTPERKNALLDHYIAITPVTEYVPVTVSFTQAGPFMPAVPVSTVQQDYPAMSNGITAPSAGQGTADPEDPNGNGLVTHKTATPNDKGGYTIHLESYTTGNVTSTEISTPVDIVLVVDQSESMLEPISSSNPTTKATALKQSLTNFITAVNKKYGPKSDHRIAIEGYADNQNHDRTYLHTGWKFVDNQNTTTLINAVNSMNFTGKNTDVLSGMDDATELMSRRGYHYTGSNTNRQKVVIVFTDGYPSTLEGMVDDDFGVDIANSSISSAHALKQNGVTVYSIGMFDGANPNELFGSYDEYHKRPCNGNPNDYNHNTWHYTNKLSTYNPASNRFLNYLSSNSANATELGLSSETYPGYGSIPTYYGFSITQNFTVTPPASASDKGYYLTAKDENELNDIFQTIVEQVSTPAIKLGTEAVVKDVVTPYFNMPADASAIRISTAERTANGWKEPVNSPYSVKATINTNSNTISVTGFNYDDNFVSDTPREVSGKDFYGKKLIIEFDVTVKDGFLGGNGVPTNGNTSGVYANNKETTALDAFTVPTVDVAIQPVTVTAQDKNIYLNGKPTDAQLLEGATAKCGEVNLDFSQNDYGLASWQTDFVILKKSVVNNSDGKNDGTYTITVTATPKNTSGTATEKTGTANGNIHVFKPEIEYNDSTISYGATADYETQNMKPNNVVWKHDTTVDTAVSMIGAKPSLDYTYNPAEAAFKQDTDVCVTVKIGDEDVTSHVTFINHSTTHEGATDHQFTVYVEAYTLTIQKTANAPGVFKFNVKNKENTVDMDVVIEVTDAHQSQTVTINGLPQGTYTVTEDTNWSWNFTATEASKTVVLKGNTRTGTASFVNTINDKWLNDSVCVKNFFGMHDTPNAEKQ